MHVRVFVISDDDLHEVTGIVAAVIKTKVTEKGFIAVKGTGHNPCQHVADHYTSVVGTENKYSDHG